MKDTEAHYVRMGYFHKCLFYVKEGQAKEICFALERKYGNI